MTVGELKEELKDIPDDYAIEGHVVLSLSNSVDAKMSDSVRVLADKDVFHIYCIYNCFKN